MKHTVVVSWRVIPALGKSSPSFLRGRFGLRPKVVGNRLQLKGEEQALRDFATFCLQNDNEHLQSRECAHRTGDAIFQELSKLVEHKTSRTLVEVPGERLNLRVQLRYHKVLHDTGRCDLRMSVFFDGAPLSPDLGMLVDFDEAVVDAVLANRKSLVDLAEEVLAGQGKEKVD